MAPLRNSLKRTLLLSTFAALALFSATGYAQDNTNTGGAQTSAQPSAESSAQTSARQSSQSATPSQEETQPSRTTQPTAVITNTGAAATTDESISAPRITGGSETGGEILTGFPSLTNAPLVTTYPPPTVPPTNNAPYMHRSSAPQGTVFIAVGAILGAFGLGILIWRGIVACLLHRSVARAANAQHLANDKASFPAPPAQFYKYTDRESTPSLVPNAGRGVRRTQRGPIPSATPSQSNLFFSPTAAGGGSNNNSTNARDSRFLPSGFYAAATSSPSPAHGHSISLTNLRPESRGQYGSRNTLRESTPPESPSFGARRDFSTSSVNLSAAPGNGQRAPSAYLEDLLDENPHAFPPNTMRPGSRNANNSPGSRF
ncbi:CSI2 protein [Colletotrichum tofieldiae]|uniref:CSI2 protein n=1 Tax=Colletotrichum tofieldiae TaxID=708197 RepID=A0A166TLG0_9PEZI|nr:CSI2 protein [Colletotrichum tofieldiae]GKT58595.1 CSI2 protein [Colletotrichum tofieldiae]GKT77989.1 CSI2 protein [Colletotrichum tofieldiae]GKT84694.1 CSI2 protein [Colletotrichum tofieldiae]